MILLLALALLGVAALLSVGTSPSRRPAQRLPYARTAVFETAAWLLCAAAAVVLVVAGAQGLSGDRITLDLGDTGGLGNADLTLDRLSGLFLLISFGVAVPVLLAAVGGRRPSRPRLPAVIALTLAAVAVVESADHLFVLLFGWESLTFAFYLLSGYDRGRAGRARASVAAVTFGKVSGAALLAGGLVLSGYAHSFRLDHWAGIAERPAGQVAYGLLILGFGVKVGLVPLQVWLPPTYSAAPGPARAIMAGVAVNVGFYGMWRTLDVLGTAPAWLATVVLVIAGVTAILGIAHAAVTPDLAGLVSWSSVENAGVITAGFGVALVGSAAHNEQLTAAGLLAATAQVVAHSLGKALLFTATAAVEQGTGTTDLDLLRGITRRLPFAGAGLVIGSLTLAGLPLTAGFASEWFTLESLMQQFRVSDLAMQLGSATAGALVALTIGVAGVTFVRLISLTAYGSPAIRVADPGIERAWGHRMAVTVLSFGCLGVAAVAPLEVRMIATGLRPIVGSAAHGALASPWVLQPVFANFSALSPTWLWIVLPSMTLLVGLVAVAFSGSRMWRIRRVPAWSSASPGVDRGVGYTSSGYANPMRRVLANLLLSNGQLERPSRPGSTPGSAGSNSGLRYEVDVVEVVEQYLYRPLQTGLMRVVRVAKRLQSGRLDAYMTYMLLALVAVLAIVTASA